MNRHTPGNWAISIDDGLRVVTLNEESRMTICEMVDLEKRSTGMFDALLIAAAPDLLAAAEEVIDELSGESILKLQDAINRARG